MTLRIWPAKLQNTLCNFTPVGFVDRLQRSWTFAPRNGLNTGFVAQIVPERSILHERSPNGRLRPLELELHGQNDEISDLWIRLVSECTQAYRECEKASSCLGNDVEDGWKIVHSGIE